jgi:hypothetical protein
MPPKGKKTQVTTTIPIQRLQQTITGALPEADMLK